MFLIVILILFLIIGFYLYFNLKYKNNLIVRFLDIGQGDSILINFKRTSILIDAGPNDTVINKLEKYLPVFENTINYVIPTHPDADHITGFVDVFKKYNIKNVFENGDMNQTTEISKEINSEISLEIKESGANIHDISCGDKLTFPKTQTNPNALTLFFLHPIQNNLIMNETNDNSIVILLVYGKYSFLFTGDMSSEIEKKIFFNIQKCFNGGDLDTIQQNLNHLTILKVSHHGSDTASSENFLKIIKPIYSVISVGFHNRYGHPKENVLSRLEKYSQYILMTKDRGDITFITDGNDLELNTSK